MFDMVLVIGFVVRLRLLFRVLASICFHFCYPYLIYLSPPKLQDTV